VLPGAVVGPVHQTRLSALSSIPGPEPCGLPDVPDETKHPGQPLRRTGRLRVLFSSPVSGNHRSLSSPNVEAVGTADPLAKRVRPARQCRGKLPQPNSAKSANFAKPPRALEKGPLHHDPWPFRVRRGLGSEALTMATMPARTVSGRSAQRSTMRSKSGSVGGSWGKEGASDF
jgi:hypothetical protein